MLDRAFDQRDLAGAALAGAAGEAASIPASSARSKMKSVLLACNLAPGLGEHDRRRCLRSRQGFRGAGRAAETLLLEARHVEAELLDDVARRFHERHGPAQVDRAACRGLGPVRPDFGRDAADRSGPAAVRGRPGCRRRSQRKPGSWRSISRNSCAKIRSSGVRAKCRKRMSTPGAVSHSQRDIAISGVTPLPPEMNRKGPSSSPTQVNLPCGPSAVSASPTWRLSCSQFEIRPSSTRLTVIEITCGRDGLEEIV